MDTQVLIIANRLHKGLKRVLDGAGFEAEIARTLPQTLQCLRRGNYGAVVIDVNRTGLDALEVVLNIRDINTLVPIVVFGMPCDDVNGRALRRQRLVTFLELRDAGQFVGKAVMSEAQ